MLTDFPRTSFTAPPPRPSPLSIGISSDKGEVDV